MWHPSFGDPPPDPPRDPPPTEFPFLWELWIREQTRTIDAEWAAHNGFIIGEG